MKKKNVIMSAVAAIVALTSIGGFTMTSYAAEVDTSLPERGHAFRDDLTDEEREELRAERVARREAVQVALEAEDYDAWVAAVGDDCLMLDKVTEENFSEFVEAHKLREQSDEIMKGIGIMGPRGRHRAFSNVGSSD